MEEQEKTAEKLAVHAYVRVDTHNEFESYLKEVGLTSASALLTLLILREIELGRLIALEGPSRPEEPRLAKVTAYVQTERGELFGNHAKALGRSKSDCAAELVEREIEERWLKTALSASLETGL